MMHFDVTCTKHTINGCKVKITNRAVQPVLSDSLFAKLWISRKEGALTSELFAFLKDSQVNSGLLQPGAGSVEAGICSKYFDHTIGELAKVHSLRKAKPGPYVT